MSFSSNNPNTEPCSLVGIQLFSLRILGYCGTHRLTREYFHCCSWRSALLSQVCQSSYRTPFSLFFAVLCCLSFDSLVMFGVPVKSFILLFKKSTPISKRKIKCIEREGAITLSLCHCIRS